MHETEPKLKRVVRAAVYARYSSEMQSPASARDQIDRICRLADGSQIPTRLFPDCQIQVLSEWIQKDEAVTGKIAGRRGYQIILDGIRRREFDILIVDDLSRLTRSLGNLLELYQLLRYYEVELVSISDRLSSADPNSRTFFTVKGMVADFGNEAHAERTRRGIEARAREGFSTGQKPYGYETVATRKDRRKNREVPSHYKILVHQGQAEIVLKIFTLYDEGHGRIFIAKTLNGESVPSPRGDRSRGWKVSQVLRILSNEKYVGQWIYNRSQISINPDTGRKASKPRPRSEWITVAREDLRIIQDDLWSRVQARLKENKDLRSRVSSKTKEQRIFGAQDRVDNLGLLTGNLVCSECGGACALVSGKGSGYYGCVEAYRHGTCKQKFLLSRATVEKAVTDFIDEKIATDPAAIQFVTDRYNEGIKKMLRRGPERKREIEVELAQVSKEIGNLVRFISQSDTADIDAVAAALRDRQARRENLEQNLKLFQIEDESRFFVTPYLVRDRLRTIIGKIKEAKGSRILKGLLEEPLVVKKLQGVLELKGRMNLGLTGRVSSQSVLMGAHLHTLRTPLFVPVYSDILIRIKTKN